MSTSNGRRDAWNPRRGRSTFRWTTARSSPGQSGKASTRSSWSSSSGGIGELFAEARRLSDGVDGRLHARTKSDAGYALILSDRRPWSKAPQLSLAPDMTAGKAFQRIVLNGFRI